MYALGEHGVPFLANRRWRISGWIIVALGAVVILGWHAGIATLVQVHPSFAPMQYNTAFCFLLCGLGVLLFDRQPKITATVASLAVLIGLVTVAEYVFGASWGLDQLFMRHYITVETSHPGRMAPNTALCFIITGTALVVVARTNGRAVRLIGFHALLLVVLGSVALIGYPTALKSSYGWGGLTSMAVHTACGFVILGSGLFLVAWVHGLSEHYVAATTSMFAAGTAIVLWHVVALHNALEDAAISRFAGGGMEETVDGTVVLVAIAGVLGTGAVALLITQLRNSSAELEHNVAARTRELDRQKFAMDEHSLVSITDPSGRITYANEKFCQINQYTLKELIGQDHRILTSGRHDSAFWAEAWNTIAAGNVWHSEVCSRAKDGSPYWADTTIVPFKCGNDRISQYVAIRSDITERKQVEETLLRVNQRLRTGVDQMPIAYILWDDQFRVIEWNPAAERIFGYSKSEMVGKYPLDYIVAEPARPLVHGVIEKLLAGEAASYSEAGNNLRKDGEVISCNWYNTPLKDETGTTVAVLSMAIDVTERRRSERELRKLSAAVEQSPAVIVITDTSGTIEYVNPRFTEVTGYAYEEAIGQNPRILKSGKLAKKAYQGLWETILAGKTWRGEFENKKKSGELYWEAASISPIRDSEGSITHFLAVKEDITERKRAEEELRQAKDAAEVASKAKSEFLANMSHEIRTPMTAIQGFAELVRDEIGCCAVCAGHDSCEKNGLAAEHIGLICRNGENLLNILNDILDLSKIEAGGMTTQREDCHPCQIVAEVASLMRVRSDAKGLAFNIEYVGVTPGTIKSDTMRLRQILINLIGNAIKFTEAGSVHLVIRFVDDENEPCMQFDVIDTGLGMTEQQVAILFQPFTQANTSATREYGGTGLGLNISKRFAELLGGEVTVVATEMGVGTTFRVTVATGSLEGVTMLENPSVATIVADSGTSVEHLSPAELRGLRILLAEDGPDNQRLIALVLEKAGADVTVAENGKIALDVAVVAMNQSREGDSNQPFDLILMDMQMPVMDGYEATGQLRQKGYTGLIIALTAHAMAGDREKCIRAGCDDHATKPIHRARLIERIQRNLVTARTTSPAVL